MRLISILIFFIFQIAQASDNKGEFAVDGAGSYPCKAYTNAWDEQSRDLYVFIGWLDGYLTGTNQYKASTFDLTPWQTSETMASLVYKACKNSPEDTFLVSAIKVLRFLKPTVASLQSDLVKISVNEQSIYLYKTTIELMQKKLSDLKYLDTYQPGSFNDENIAALKLFQKKNKLTATGFPDQTSLITLLLGQDKVQKITN